MSSPARTLYPDHLRLRHYDSVNCPAANDNASGVAGVLRPRVLSQYPSDYHRFIAFDQEERA